MVKYRNLFFVVLCFVFLTASLFGQIPTKGNIFGTVTDEEGVPLPGVAVEAISPSLLGKVATLTDGAGKYRLLSLQPGIYTITFTLQGFKHVTRSEIVIQINQTITVDVQMGMGTIEEEITVVGQSPLIDVKSTTKGMTLTKMMFEVLPKGRNFDTLVTAVPGVNVEPGFGGSGMSVDGASSAENMYYVDGTDIGSITTGVREQSAAFEFVEEVQVLASGYEAEYGGAVGGVVSVITRQGGNEFHGELIGYYEGSSLEGKERDTLRRNPLNTFEAEYVNYQDLYGKDKINRTEIGFSLGGYIIKDRVWFFGSFLPVFRNTTRHVEFLTTPVQEGDYERKQTYWNFQGKITAQPFGFMRVGASFVNNFYKYRGNLPARDGTGNPDDPDWANYGFDYPNWSASGFADMTLGANLMMNIRGGRFFYDQTNQQVLPEIPNYRHYGSGAAYFDGTPLEVPSPWNVPYGYTNKGRGNVVEKLERYKNHLGADFTYFTYLGGEHAFKFGVQYVRQGEDVNSALGFPYAPEIRLYWGQDAVFGGVNYGTGTYGYYEVRGNTESGVFGEKFDVHNDRWAIYAQDSWTLGERFTLNLGIRFESEYVPPYSEDPSIPSGFKPMEFTFGDKIAPRLGFIYDVFGDTSLKIFGSFGMYYDVIKTYMPAHSYAGFKWKSAYYKMDSYEWDTFGIGENYPGEHIVTLDWRKPSFDSTDPDIKPVNQREFSFGLEKMLMENFSGTIRVVQKSLRHTMEDVGVIIPGVGESYFECNPGFGYSLHVGNGSGKFDPKYPETPRAKREYLAVNISLDKRLSNNWLGGFSYTWSRLWGNYAGLASADEWNRVSPYVMRNYDNWAMAQTKNLEPVDNNLSTDRTHFFKFYGAYTFPFRLTVGAVINAMSGTPIDESWDMLSAYINPYDRFHWTDPSTGEIVQARTPFYWYCNLYAEYNLKLSDRYRIQLNVNVDNLFDTAIAQRVYADRTMYGLHVTEDEHLSKAWDITDAGRNFTQEPRYGKKFSFQGPISLRLGLKFMF
jgi:hypothetical protein